MKRISYTIFLLAIVCTSMVSCKKFLEKEPFGKTGKNTLFETVTGAKQGITGSYNRMLDYYKNEFGMYGDVASDNVIRNTSSTSTVMVQQFNYQSSVSDDAFAVGHIWLDIYETLNNVNNVLNAVPELKTKFPDQTKTLDSITGQGLVMRAICHFDLSRVYAQSYKYTGDASHLGVPVLLKTPSPGEQVPRKTMRETYDQIILDLTNALPLLQQHANHTTQASISYQAALALLSRVNLYKGDWAQSINYANLMISDTRYQLASSTSYKSSFITYLNNNAAVKVENIFQLTNAGLPNGSANVFSVYSDAATAQYTASSKLKGAFDADDIRLTQMFNVPTTGINLGRSVTTKYADGVLSTVNPPAVQVIRLSEVYLNRAEAKWNLQQYTAAAEDLRIISQRAHPDRTITIIYNSPEDLYKQITDERNRELCFEGHRLFDLARRKENMTRGADCNATVCQVTFPNDKFVLPIPQKEIEANRALIPNPGFN